MGKYILNELTRSRIVLYNDVKDLPEEAFDIIPEGFNNNIRWHIGHLIVTTNMFVFKNIVDIPAHYEELFSIGTKPVDWPEQVPSSQELLTLWNAQRKALAQIDISNYDEPLEKPIFRCNTIGEFAAMGSFHEAYHVGQVHTLLRIVQLQLVN